MKVLKQVAPGDTVSVLVRGETLTGIATGPANFAGQSIGWVVDIGARQVLATPDNFLSVQKS